jgi:hypothetical protein
MKRYFDSFIYGLLYPGFVGSMLYEVIPKDVYQFYHYWTYETIIKIAITLFYSLDYVHLYVDIHEEIDIKDRNGLYLFCDFSSSALFFAAFLAANLVRYDLSVIFISIVPTCFCLYKVNYKIHIPFHLIYAFCSLALLAIYILNQYSIITIKITREFRPEFIVICIIGASIVTYIFYLVCYRIKYRKRKFYKIATIISDLKANKSLA